MVAALPLKTGHKSEKPVEFNGPRWLNVVHVMVVRVASLVRGCPTLSASVCPVGALWSKVVQSGPRVCPAKALRYQTVHTNLVRSTGPRWFTVAQSVADECDLIEFGGHGGSRWFIAL